MMQPQETPWDMTEYWLARAVSAVEAFELALDRPDVTLSVLRHGPEKRMAAELAGLSIACGHPAERMATSHLESTRSRSALWAEAITLVLLATRRYDLAHALLAALPTEAVPGAIRAVALAADRVFDAIVLRELANPRSPVAQPILLEIVARRRLHPPTLAPFLASAYPATVAAALRAATGPMARLYRKTIVGLLKDPVGMVRDAAMRAGLHVASQRAWRLCKELALEDVEPHHKAMCIVGGLGTRQDHIELAKRLTSARHRPHVIRALGFAGDATCVPDLLDIAAGPNRPEARLAAEAIATITGFEVRSGKGCPAPPNGGLAAHDGDGTLAVRSGSSDLATPAAVCCEPVAPENWLPEPDIATLRSWWSGNGRTFQAEGRYLGGRPRSLGVLVEMLGQVPMRRCHVLAQILSMRTGGRLYVDTRALTSEQQAQIERAAFKIGHGIGKFREPF